MLGQALRWPPTPFLQNGYHGGDEATSQRWRAHEGATALPSAGPCLSDPHGHKTATRSSDKRCEMLSPSTQPWLLLIMGPSSCSSHWDTPYSLVVSWCRKELYLFAEAGALLARRWSGGMGYLETAWVPQVSRHHQNHCKTSKKAFHYSEGSVLCQITTIIKKTPICKIMSAPHFAYSIYRHVPHLMVNYYITQLLWMSLNSSIC